MKKKSRTKTEHSIEIDPMQTHFVINSRVDYYENDEQEALHNFDIKIFSSHIDGEYFDFEQAENISPAYRHYLESGISEIDEDMGNFLVGRAKVFLGNFDQYDEMPGSVLDYEESTSDFIEFYDDGEFCEDVVDSYLDVFSTNLLIIDRIEILPYFRNQYLGLVALVKLSRTLKLTAQVIALKPYPIQTYPNHDSSSHPYWRKEWTKAMCKPDFVDKAQWEKDKIRLTNYYKKAGFRPIRNGKFMISESPALDGRINKILIKKHWSKAEEFKRRFYK